MRGLLKCAFLLPYFAMAAPTLRTKGELQPARSWIAIRCCSVIRNCCVCCLS